MDSLGEGPVDETLAKLLDEPLLDRSTSTPSRCSTLSAEPKLAGTVAALFNLYKNTRTQLENVMAQLSSVGPTRGDRDGAGVPLDYSPFDEVTDFLQRTSATTSPSSRSEAERLRQRLRPRPRR